MLTLPRGVKRLIAITLDAALCVLTVWIAFYLRLGYLIAFSAREFTAVVVALTIAIPIFIVAGLYRAIFRYVNSHALMTIAQACLGYGIIFCAIFTAIGVEGVPRTIGFIQPVLLFIAVSGARLLTRYILSGEYQKRLRQNLKRNVIIYGAGMTGRQLVVAAQDSSEMRVVGLVDDARDIQGSVINGVRIYAPGALSWLVGKYDVQEVILAVPSASRRRRNQILSDLRSLNVNVRTLPPILDLAHGKVSIAQLRPLDIDDLLSRNVVPPNQDLLGVTVSGKVVMVTGAGGSIGSEICRQIVSNQPAQLVLVDHSEFALYAIHRELKRIASPDCDIVPLLASVCEEARMRRIFNRWRPQTIYHAAAYKHVPLVEHNVVDGVRNNVLGTFVCAMLAKETKAQRFVLVSTDKAVRPTNVMGASKRAAEMTLQAIGAEHAATAFAMVRFGNVLGSSGSVVPLFRQQIAMGGPVTVTHAEVTRYFMTIPEAAQLVLQAGAMSEGGEVYVLDMGEPIRIIDLAQRMIELSGLRMRSAAEPEGDIEIEVTGLRPGEKLYEELLIGDSPSPTHHPRIMRASESFVPWRQLEPELDRLLVLLKEQDFEGVRSWLIRLIPEYVPAGDLVDFLIASQEELLALDQRADSHTIPNLS
jgi:FlaA1/EpsC-like NDP-sugar epimerase